MMKKIRGVIIIMTLSLLVAGCQSNTDKTETVESTENITLHWMIAGEKAISTDSVIASFNNLLQEYYPNITVEFEIVSLTEYVDYWNVKMATNETLDLVWISNDLFNYTEEVNEGGLMALDYLLSTDGSDLLDSIPDELWEMQTHDDKIYSVPILGELYRKEYAIVTSSGKMNSFGDLETIIEVNTSNLYTTQECFDVVEEYLYNLKEAKSLGTGVSTDTFAIMAEKGYEGVYGADSPFVIRIFDEELQVYNRYEEEAYQAYFATMSSWYQQGYIREDVLEVLESDKYNGAIAGSAIYIDEYVEVGESLSSIQASYDTVSIPLQTYSYISYESCRNAIAIPRTTEYTQEAMQVINLLNSEEGEELVKLLAYGFEGRHYVTTNDDNVIQYITDTEGEFLYGISPEVVGNVFYNYESYSGEFEEIYEMNENAIMSKLIGFELDTRMIVTELAKIDLVIAEFIEILESGTAENWEEVYEEMLLKMNEAGAEKVMEEIQRQFDLFVSGE